MKPRSLPGALVLIATSAVAVLATTALGCGGDPTPSGNEALDHLRMRAHKLPNDPEAVVPWALGEMFLVGGDAKRTKGALERASELDPKNVAVAYARGLERNLHGDPDVALASYVEAVRLASLDAHPVASRVAEAALAGVERLGDHPPGGVDAAYGVLRQVWDAPGALDVAARHTLGMLLMDRALRDGDLARVDAITVALGCAKERQVIGPFGPRALLGFDDAYPPEADAAWAETYDLRTIAGTRPVRTLAGRGCAAHLGAGPGGMGGTFYSAETHSVATAGRYDLRLETPNAAKLFVDGRLVKVLDRRREPTPRVSYIPLELTAGAHRIVVKVTTRHPNPVLLVALGPSGSATRAGAATSEGEEPFRRVPTDPLHGYLEARIAVNRGDTVGARELLQAHAATKEASATMLMLAAEVAYYDPTVGDEGRRDEVRRLVGVAERRDKSLWYSAVLLAQLDSADGHAVKAIERLEGAAKKWPRQVELWTFLASLYQSRNWESQTDQAIAIARKLSPAALGPVVHARARAVARKNYALVESLSEEVMKRDARQEARLDLLLRARNWSAAETEAKRLSALNDLDGSDADEGTYEGALRIARGRGDVDGMRKAVDALAAEQRDVFDAARDKVDLALAAGEKDQAHKTLEAALARSAGRAPELYRVGSAVFHDHPLDAYRLDGATVIRDFVKSGRAYDQPKIMVLDYTVIRVFEDGSSAELTHNIWRAQSDEGVNDLGEYSVRDGAELYTLRTHKADGRVLEPDVIRGKETLSLPDLQPGDFVEAEYVRYLPPSALFPKGYQTWRFFFESPEEAFDRSEFTVVVPKGTDPVVDARGNAPKTERSVKGDTEVLHWLARESRPITPEPGSVSGKEFIASVQASHAASWQDLVDAYRDALADADQADPRAARLAMRIAGPEGEAPRMDRAKRLYDWVVDNIEQENDVYGSAAAMVNAKSGHRARVFHYLAGLAGIPSDLLVAKTLASDPSQGEVADAGEYGQVLVEIVDGDVRRPIAVADRTMPFGYIPPMLRGQSALRITANAEALRLPAESAVSDLRRIAVQATVALHGSATFDVTETHRGATAIRWRNDLEQIAEATLRPRFGEAYVARLVPGAELQDLDIQELRNRDVPLVLHYTFSVPELGRVDGNARVLGAVFPTMLAPIYASLATRKYTALVGLGQSLDVELRFHLAKGLQVSALPERAHLTSVGGSAFDYGVQRTEDGFLIRRQVSVPEMRVAPEAYPEFAAFCREADRLEDREIRVLTP
ncbi:MAG: hypothetical protein KC417_04040 [Myxococcales bacterium]|nr:hypothetical protein [Myxococcales bacterium]